MPLSCDCYPGCWGQHSLTWAKVVNSSEGQAQSMFRSCVKVLRYGTYVRFGLEVRFENFSDIKLVRKHMAGAEGEHFPNQGINSVV